MSKIRERLRRMSFIYKYIDSTSTVKYNPSIYSLLCLLAGRSIHAEISWALSAYQLVKNELEYTCRHKLPPCESYAIALSPANSAAPSVHAPVKPKCLILSVSDNHPLRRRLANHLNMEYASRAVPHSVEEVVFLSNAKVAAVVGVAHDVERLHAEVARN